MFTLSDVPRWYLVVAVLYSCYQGYRGFMLQWIWGRKVNVTKTQRVVLLCLSDMISYFLCTLVGFASLFMAYRFTSRASVLSKLDIGSSLLLIFLVLLGILGVTGQLLYLIQQGKLPWFGKE
jgi:hypothetical protein